MMNWYEIEVEEKIAQERYRAITDPVLKQVGIKDAGPPRARQVLAWTGRRLTRLGCSLQVMAGEACV